MMDFQAGSEISFMARPPVTQQQLNAYAEASGDPNQIHLDEAVAKSMGLPGVIAHGMLSAAFLAERAQQVALDLPDFSSFVMKRFQSRFKAMVFLNDLISVGGTVREMSESKWVFELQAKNQKNKIVTSATVEFVRI